MHRQPRPDFGFHAGDIVVVVGTADGTDGVAELLTTRLGPACTTTASSSRLGAVILASACSARCPLRFGISPIPLYLLAGLAFGTGGVLPLTTSEEFIATGAEIGVILLLFTLGLEYTAAELVGTLRTQRPRRPRRPGAQRRARRRRGAAARLGPGRRRRDGRHHLRHLLRHHREGPRATWAGSATARRPVVLSLLVFEDLTMALYLPILTALLAGVGPARRRRDPRRSPRADHHA